MISIDDCLKYAAECEEMAQDPALAEDREQLLKIANLWRQMAIDQAGAPVQ